MALISTTTGLQLLIRALEYKVPNLTLQKIDGRLLGNINIKGLNYHNDSVSLQINQANMKINLLKCLIGKLEFQKLTLTNTNIITSFNFPKKSNRSSGFNLEKIHKIFQINHGEINNLSYHFYNQMTFNIKHIDIEAFTPSNLLKLNITSKNNPETHINAQIKHIDENFHLNVNVFNNKAQWHTQAVITPATISGNSYFNDTSFAKFNINRKQKNQSTWSIANRSIPLNEINPYLPFIREISGSGAFKDHIFNNQVQANGKILSRPFSLTLASNTVKQATQSKVNFKYGSNHIDLQMDQNQSLSIKWQASISKLNDLFHLFNGQIKTQGTFYLLNGSIDSNGSINGTDLRHSSIKAKTLSAQWDIKKQHLKQATATIQHAKYHKVLFKQILIHCHEAQNMLVTTIQVLQGDKSLNMSMDTSIKKNNRHIKINTFTIRDKQMWRLRSPVTVTWKGHNIDLNQPFYLSNLSDHISINAIIIDNIWNTRFHYSGQQLQSLINWIDPNFLFSGDVNFDLDASGNTQQISHGQFQLKTKNNLIKHGSMKLNLGHIDFKGQFTPKTGLTSLLKVNPPKHKVITARFSLPKFKGHGLPKASEPIQGQLNWSGPITVIDNYIPKIFQPEGMLSIQAQLGGTLNVPQIKSNIQVNQGSLDIPQYGIELKKIQSRIWSASNIIHLESKVFIDQKPVSITGKYNISQREGLIHLQANQTQFWNTLSYQFTASPKLAISIKNKDILVSGRVIVDKGLISPPNFNQVISMPSEAEIITKTNTKKKESSWSTQLLINIKAQKDLIINTMGLKGAASGEIILKKNKHQAINATGSLHIVPNTATLNISGQTLKVPSGALIFSNSPITNPNVNIHVTRKLNQNAMRTFREISNEPLTVGINITGYLNNLNINFFSTPIDLPQEKILSYLIIGQSLTGDASGNAPAILQALNQLSSRNSSTSNLSDIQNQIQNKLGLSEMTVESQDLIDSLGNTIDHQTSVVLGKHLFPNVYIRYNIGLLDPINTWQIRYTLNHRWSIQSDTNVRGTGFDLFYRIERGKTN